MYSANFLSMAARGYALTCFATIFTFSIFPASAAGTWTYSDGGEIIQHTRFDDRTFRPDSEMTSPSYPHVELETILLTLQSTMAQGTPGKVVTSSDADSTFPGVLFVSLVATCIITFASSLLIIHRYKGAAKKVMEAKSSEEDVDPTFPLSRDVKTDLLVQMGRKLPSASA